MTSPVPLKNAQSSAGGADSPSAAHLDDEEDEGLTAGEERNCVEEEMEEFDEEVLLDSEDMGAAAADGDGDVDVSSPSRSSNYNAMCRRVGDEVKCSACDFTTRSRIMLQRHERLTHLKKKFFRCVKCNYVTHVKARYTKHVKYHSMPMIKCDLCEFRTPYKWNLDRHLKNHMGGGMYKCSLCNFTAHIKQSLTVHIQNHHLSPEKARSARRRNKVGASDEMAEAAMDADELELLRLEREADEDGPLDENDDQRIPEEMMDLDTVHEDDEGAKSAGLKMTFRKIKSPAKGAPEEPQSDFVHPDDLIQKNGRVYLKNLKCSQCSFKAVWESELARHEAKVHGFTTDKEQPAYLPEFLKNVVGGANRNLQASPLSPVGYLPSPPSSEPSSVESASAGGSSRRKTAPRPIPNLIPINTSSVGASPPSSGEKAAGPTILKIPQIRKRSWEASDNGDDVTTSPILEAVGLFARSNVAAEVPQAKTMLKNGDPSKKKSSSFLDQLAEKLAGNETKHSAVEQVESVTSCAPPAAPRLHNPPAPNLTSMSSRCQHCRQRCKTRADLQAHLKNCPQAIAAAAQAAACKTDEVQQSASTNSSGHPPHPMENKVFVWTRMEEEAEAVNYQDDVEPMDMDAEDKRPSSVAGSDVSEASLVGVETAPGIGAVTGGAGSSGLSLDNGRSSVRRVYRCPQCSFWATTASRFHVHMVGHTNTKPFECSQCAYRSNWRWDITKHIKLKAARDPGHTQARVLLLDASGERHYDQYDRYLVMMRVTEAGGASLTHGRIQEERAEIGNRPKSRKTADSLSPSPSPSPSASPVPQPANETLAFNIPGLSPSTAASLASSFASLTAFGRLQPPKTAAGKSTPGSQSLSVRQPPPLNALFHSGDAEVNHSQPLEDNEPSRKKMLASASGGHLVSSLTPPPPPSSGSMASTSASHSNESRRTIWKCKRCAFKDHNRELVLQHIRYAHYQGVGNSSSSNPQSVSTNAPGVGAVGAASGGGQSVEVGSAASPPPTSPQPPPPPPPHSSCPSPVPAFRCGVCNQVSNWKHVIQRHCRLKHNGNIQVIENKGTEEDGPELSREGDSPQRNSSSKLNNSLLSSKRGSSKPSNQNPVSIDEDSMGYIMHPDRQQYLCSLCPFVCKSLTDIEMHRQNHKPGAGRPVKCTFCPYFVSDKQEMSHHMCLHGVRDLKVDAGGNLSSLLDGKQLAEEAETLSDGSGPKRFKCSACPYVSDSKSQYVYHRQFHRPRGAPYKCPKCSYNVSRRHLLNQHLRVHGLPPVKGEGSMGHGSDQYGSDSDGAIGSEAEAEAEAAEAGEMAEEEIDTESSAHSDKIENAGTSSTGSDGYTHLGLDPATMPTLTDSATVNLADIPLTWVSRGSKFYKMFKCRHCPHVNVRKANIQEHEKRHQTRAGGSKSSSDNLHACTICNYRCNNAGVLSAHVKVHQSVLGIIHGFAETSKTDEDQLRSLGGKPDLNREAAGESNSAPQPKLDILLARDDKDSNSGSNHLEPPKVLHFCAHCPARFLVETELLIHQRFHGVKLPYRCDVCSYTARQENHLLAHWKVHSREYQERTKVLLEQHGVSEKYPQPRILAVQANISAVVEEEGAMDLTSRKSDKGADSAASTESKSSLVCSLCPAKFSKELALKYHISLHGSNGQFRCRYCNYAVKAQDNLVKHEKLHKSSSIADANSPSLKSNNRMTHQPRDVPLSGLDLALRRQEEQEQREPASVAVTSALVDSSGESSGSSPGKPGGKGRSPGKRFQCPKCPSIFEKKEQYRVHCNLHGSKQKYLCDKCDYAVKYYANYLQHMKKHEEYEKAVQSGGTMDFSQVEDSEAEMGETITLADGDVQLNAEQQTFTTAERQHLWLQDKLRPKSSAEEDEPFHCQYCPFKTGRKDELDGHVKNHAVNGATGSYRCNFCDYTVLEEQSQLYEHIQLHFQLKSRVKLESYWKCSNLEIWSEPVGGSSAETVAESGAETLESEMVFDEKVKHDFIDSEDEDALYIDLSTGHPSIRDERTDAITEAITGSAETALQS